jgi:hypothetical protein
MTLAEATEKGIGKLRLPNWKYAHIELYLCTVDPVRRGAWGEKPEAEGQLYHGPWLRLYDPPSMLAMGKRWNDYTEVSIIQADEKDFEEWKEPADYGRFAECEPAPQV